MPTHSTILFADRRLNWTIRDSSTIILRNLHDNRTDVDVFAQSEPSLPDSDFV